MPYPVSTPDDVLRFEADGFLVVKDAISPEELETLARVGAEMIDRPEDWDNDWDWRKGRFASFNVASITDIPGYGPLHSDFGQAALVRR